jgi:hypothetical protein
MEQPKPAGAQIILTFVQGHAIKNEALSASGMWNTEEPSLEEGSCMRVSREQDLWHQHSHATVQHAADKFLLTVWGNTVAAAYAYPWDLLVGQNNLVEVSHHTCSLWAHDLLS